MDVIATRPRQFALKTVSCNDDGSAAGAGATPSGLSIFSGSSSELDDNQCAETLPDEVLEVERGRQCDNIIVGHAGLRFRSAVSGRGGRVQRSLPPFIFCLFYSIYPSIASAQQTLIGDRLEITNQAELNGTVGPPDYISQLTKWRIDNLGAADFRYLFTDELHAKSFIAELKQALAGGQIIGKSVAMLASNFTVPAAAGVQTLTVRDLPSAENMAVFESGDTIRLRSFSRAAGSLTIADAYGVVTAYADQAGGVQTWTFTRNSGADAGGMTGGTVIQADALVLDYGTSGNGVHEINAIDGVYGLNSPYAQVVTWTTSPIAANLTVRSRIGNLRGVTGVAGEYGAILGTYAASNGQFVRVSNQAVELHGVNLQMWDGATNVIKLDRTAPSFALGTPVPSAYSTGTGVWMGNDGGTYKFRVGNPVGNRLTWDGTTLSVVGDGAGVTNIAGGNIQTDTITATQIAANAITTSELTADSVTSAKIAAGTIVASDISGGTITADKLSVTTLSAISANLGTVTAGSISGVTATFGGAVTLDSSGISIVTGSASVNKIKFSSGASVYTTTSNDLVLLGTDILIAAPGGSAVWTGSAFYSNTAGDDLGTSSARWEHLFLSGDINWVSPPTTTSPDYPLVYSTGNTIIYRKTDGFDGTCNSPTSIIIERGIVTGCS